MSFILANFLHSLVFILQVMGLAGPGWSPSNANPVVDIHLSTAQNQAVVGERIIWQVSIELPDQQVAREIKIRSGDEDVWLIYEGYSSSGATMLKIN